tara:strand:+ start:242 stop:475 length:234 start_codon:yes stop_codon:yes gene_type:complete
MSEEQNEMLVLLKELVDKVKNLEQAVYNKDNLLMKSGFVVVDSPTPAMSNSSEDMPSGDIIAKMDWEDIHKIVENMG